MTGLWVCVIHYQFKKNLRLFSQFRTFYRGLPILLRKFVRNLYDCSSHIVVLKRTVRNSKLVVISVTIKEFDEMISNI